MERSGEAPGRRRSRRPDRAHRSGVGTRPGAADRRPVCTLWAGPEWFPTIGGLLWASLLILGPVGIAVAGWSAGVRGWGRWLALLVWSLPLYAFFWFGSAARFSGTMGNPF